MSFGFGQRHAGSIGLPGPEAPAPGPPITPISASAFLGAAPCRGAVDDPASAHQRAASSSSSTERKPGGPSTYSMWGQSHERSGAPISRKVSRSHWPPPSGGTRSSAPG